MSSTARNPLDGGAWAFGEVILDVLALYGLVFNTHLVNEMVSTGCLTELLLLGDLSSTALRLLVPLLRNGVVQVVLGHRVLNLDFFCGQFIPIKHVAFPCSRSISSATCPVLAAVSLGSASVVASMLLGLIHLLNLLLLVHLLNLLLLVHLLHLLLLVHLLHLLLHINHRISRDALVK
jgi:hypothetical protein